MQAVKEEEKDGSGDDFGGGVLHKRQRAGAQDEQSDGEAADLQQVTPHAPCFHHCQPALSRTILCVLPFMMHSRHCPCYLPVPCLIHPSALPCASQCLALYIVSTPCILWSPRLVDTPDSYQGLGLPDSEWG